MHPKSSSSGKTTGSDRTVVAAIPVRYGSTRLPGKALLEIDGKPMIERVYRRVQVVDGLTGIVVLTDDDRIARTVESFGGEVEMTPVDCASGTDRIAFAARDWTADAVINVQGDEPLIEPKALEQLARHLIDNPNDPVVTLASPAEATDPDNPNVVKVVVDKRGYALYFSRAAIPYRRGEGPRRVTRHIGVYGYQRPALLEIAACEPSTLELTEALEQLRMLENGFRIRVLETAHAWPGVDTMEDLERVEELVRTHPRLAGR